MVQTGTGILILATKGLDIYQNKIINNQTASTGIISYYTTGKLIKDEAYDPFPSAISIHDNLYERKPGLPVGTDALSAIFARKFKDNTPHIFFDGIKNPTLLDAKGNWIAGQCISIVNNQNQSIATLDAQNQFKGMARADDSFKCVN